MKVRAVSPAIILAMCLTVIVNSGTAQAASPCTDVEVVGLRGSSEEYLASQHGMGSLLGPVTDAIATELAGALTFSAYGVPYPASEASLTTVLDLDYTASKNAGSKMLHEYLSQRSTECPATRFVVMGYSQGAHAAGDQLAREGKSITDRIAAFVMFGDPRFNPAATYALGTFDNRDHGLAGARPTSDFSGWSSRVYSFCHQNDEVCQGFGIGHGSAAHSQAKYVSDYADLVAGVVRHRLGLPALPRTPLDLAFVIDSTGSMAGSIDGVREAAASIGDKLAASGGANRIALVDYKDTDQGDPYAARVDLDLGSDTSAFRDSLDALQVSGGGDYPEAVFSGLMKAFTGLSWRPQARKAVILMGDAPGKDPEPVTGYTHASVVAAAHALGAASPMLAPAAAEPADSSATEGASVYPLAVGFGPLETFEPLAEETGGQLFMASDPSAVSDEILETVGAAAGPAELTLSSVAPTRPGIAVPFNAGAAYLGGEIVEYAWDFDGDGVVDETTTVGQVSHVYPEPFEGFARVTAIADDGHELSASTPVLISEYAPIPAGPPRQLSVTSSTPGSLRLSWMPPSDLGGGSLVGYEVVIDNAEGEVETAAAVPSWQGSLNLASVPAGTYSASVAAITEAGPGAEAKGSATVGATVSPPPPSQPRVETGGPVVVGPIRHPVSCRKGFHRAKVHGRVTCVKHKHRHAHRKHRHHHAPN